LVNYDVFFLNFSCGYYHSGFVSVDGCVYMFGESDGGKLGVEGQTVDVPTKVDIDEKVRQKNLIKLFIGTEFVELWVCQTHD